MVSATITVQMDSQGRITVPKVAREKLGVDGESVMVECEVRVDE